MPSFVVAPVLQLVFGLWLKWLPVGGAGGPSHYVLPVRCWPRRRSRRSRRLTRAAAIEALAAPYQRTALAYGLSERVRLARAFRAALLPLVSYLGPAAAAVMTGSVVVENLFGLPGVGRYFVQAALDRDYTVSLGAVLLVAGAIVLFNLIVDIAYAVRRSPGAALSLSQRCGLAHPRCHRACFRGSGRSRRGANSRPSIPTMCARRPALAPHPTDAEARAALNRVAGRMRARAEDVVIADGEARAKLVGASRDRPARAGLFRAVRRFRARARGAGTAATDASLWSPRRSNRCGCRSAPTPTAAISLARLMLAGRVSLLVGALGSAVALVIGVAYGMIAGYAGGKLDLAMMRAVDALYALPFIFFVILLTAFFGRHFALIFIAIGAVEWLDMARLARGQTLSLKSREFVLAARALGVSGPAILARHIAPNLAGVVLAYLAVLAPRVILVESFLSFLGLGVREPLTSLGVLVADGARHIEDAPWLLIAPAMLLTSAALRLRLRRRSFAADAEWRCSRSRTSASPTAPTQIVRGVSLHIEAGEVVAIVGESGSGKTQTLLAALGLLARRRDGQRLGAISRPGVDRRLRARRSIAMRGDRVTMVFQEPMSALDPLVRVGDQIAAPYRRPRRRRARPRIAGRGRHRRRRGAGRRLSASALRRRTAARDDRDGARQPPGPAHRRRTDHRARRDRGQSASSTISRRSGGAHGLAMILVTHDLRLARRYASRLYVMREGQIIEEGATAAVLAAPRAAYTRSLIEAATAGAAPASDGAAPEVLAGRGVRVVYGRKAAVDGVDLTLRRGRTLAVVGESGSGKSTLARALLRLIPAKGEIAWLGRQVARLEGAALRRARAAAQIVFQDPYAALSPRLTIEEIVVEGLRAQGRADRRRGGAALVAVGLDPTLASRTPDALSGGQRQRVAIARALALEPAALVLDEPTSSLDRGDAARHHRAASASAGRARAGLSVHHPRSRARAGAWPTKYWSCAPGASSSADRPPRFSRGRGRLIRAS